ncbi:precorrin-3B synthase [Novacetimonas maltaceti]|uniref:Ferredoxin-nitrite reductase n=1 Tax=Novacetimonas maltaceti TaxID=1203393 RepID=A0A2S3W0G8_9PROT|nr:precorrin-3B synthase [Novacetimonas maltaceti]POF62361.1 ferredoxin-nitrite reductase [Novacetimonas maltaceti]PYD59510.1 precorrin-3B synthase [Novacetimonas maltaceti]
MSAPPTVRGWCPGLHTPMEAADGWLVRVRPPLGQLTAAQAEAIAHATTRLGNGRIELTSRGNLQLRGFSPETAQQFACGLRDCGLGGEDASERRRAVLLSPLAGLDPACDPHTLSIARALDAHLAAAAHLSALPAKFVMGVDGGGYVPAGAIRADITACAKDGHWHVTCGNARSACAPDAVPGLMVRLAEAFVRIGGTIRPLRRRDIGMALFAQAGIPAEPHDDAPAPTFPALVGALPGGCYGVTPPLGRMGAHDLSHLARRCATDGAGIMRMGPGRAIVLPGLAGAPDIAGFVTDPHDPRLRIVACIGRQGCACTVADVGADALALASDVPWGMRLHVSGCPKGCANPGRCDITLVADGTGYGLCRDARAADAPLLRGLDVAQVRTLLHEGRASADTPQHQNGEKTPA